MKKKFIFAVLVILAFGLSIGCANESSVEVPVEYLIYNKCGNGIDVEIRVCEVGIIPNNDSWDNEIIQVLTPPILIKDGEMKTVVVDVSNCMEYNSLYVETTWIRNNKFYDAGFVDWCDIHYILTELNGQRELTLTKMLWEK